MQQTEILKSLLSNYVAEGGDVNDLVAATDYINQHKPPGCGRAKPVITHAIFRLMGQQPTSPKPAKTMLYAEPAPASHIIASKTVTFPEVMPAKPVAVYRETASTPETPAAPEPEPAPVQIKDPATTAQTREDVTPPKKSLWNKLKFWKK